MLSNKGAAGGLVILFIALFFIGYFVYFISLFTNYKKTGSNNYEEKMNEASLRYVNDYYSEFKNNGDLIIKLSNLKKYNYIDLDDCVGYSIINNKNKLSINSYVKCNKYITEGYNEMYE